MIKRRKKTRKNKYVMLFSPPLMQETKHELIGEPFEGPNGMQQWALCTKSHHKQLITLDSLEAEGAESDAQPKEIVITRESSVTYDPRKQYNIGDVIYHGKWDDLGLVRGKEITSSGGHAIVVEFEKNKVKRLIENLTV